MNRRDALRSLVTLPLAATTIHRAPTPPTGTMSAVTFSLPRMATPSSDGEASGDWTPWTHTIVWPGRPGA